MLFYGNQVEAYIGKLKNDETIAIGEDAEVAAKSDTNARLIAGSLNVSPAKLGVGLTVGAIANDGVGTTDHTEAHTAGKLTVGGGFAQTAENLVDYLSVTVAASVDDGASGNTIGGAVNVIDMQNQATSRVTGQILAQDNVDILARNESRLIIVPLTVSAAGKVAGGAAVSVIVTDAQTQALVDSEAKITSSNGSVTISSQTDEGLMAFTTAGAASAGTAAVGATVAVLISQSDTKAAVDSSAITAGKDILVQALGDSWTLTTIVAIAGSTGNAAGAGSVAVSIFDRTVLAQVTGGSELTANQGSVIIEALGRRLLRQRGCGSRRRKRNRHLRQYSGDCQPEPD